MILVFDIGNTNIKIGVFDKNELLYSLRLASSAHKTGDEYWLLLKDMLSLKGIKPEDVNGAIVSSVNPNLNYTIEHMLQYSLGVKPLIVGAGLKIGLNIKYDNPKEVGSDRIVGAVAAYNIYGGPCIVIDCGTATTFNVINAKGEYLGGAISFGLKTASDALSRAGAKLPKIELNIPEKVINSTTISNMQSGILYGFIGMLEYMVKKIKEEIGEAKVIATGGLGGIIINNTKVIDFYDKTLTLRGLNIVYGLNVKIK